MRGKLESDPEDWGPTPDGKEIVSHDAMDVIKKMALLAPKERLAAEQCLDHVWIEAKAPNMKGEIVGFAGGFVKNLQKKKTLLRKMRSRKWLSATA